MIFGKREACRARLALSTGFVLPAEERWHPGANHPQSVRLKEGVPHGAVP